MATAEATCVATCECRLLKSAVQTVKLSSSRAISKANQYVLIEVEYGWISIVSGASGYHIRRRVPAQTSGSGRAMVDTSVLARLLSAADGDITMTLSGDSVELEWSNSRYRVLTVEEYDILEPDHGDVVCEISACELRKALQRVAFAAAPSGIGRYNLEGVNFCVHDGRLTLVATDGVRIAWHVTDVSQCSKDFSCLIPARAAKVITHFLDDEGDNTIKISGGLMFTGETGHVDVLPLDATFPKWTHVVEHYAPEVTVQVDADQLRMLVRNVSVVIDKKIPRMLIETVNGGIVAKNHHGGDVTAECIVGAPCSPGFSVIVDCYRLLDWVERVDGVVTVGIRSDGVCLDAGGSHMVMAGFTRDEA